MENKSQSGQYRHNRKFLLFLPLLVLPFTTLLFWSLGGGQGADAGAGQVSAQVGLNAELPPAYLKDDGALTKLSYYEKAASDSAKLQSEIENDPFYLLQRPNALNESAPSDTNLIPHRSQQETLNSSNRINPSPYHGSSYSDPNEARVYQKLDALNAALNEAATRPGKARVPVTNSHAVNPTVNSADIDRLEQLMNMAKDNEQGEDPELNQLNEVMEKIMDIQHPDRVKQRITQNPDTTQRLVYTITNGAEMDNSSLFGGNASLSPENNREQKAFSKGFYSIHDEKGVGKETVNAIQAVIHETQTIVDGSPVKLRLANDITVNGTVVPKGSFVFGMTSLDRERIMITISSLRYKESVFPVHLVVVDLDGMDGISVPESLAGEVTKLATERAIEGITFPSLDPSIGAKAASAGIEAAKALLNRKSKQIRIILKGGYRVLLRDEKQKIHSSITY